MAWLAISLLAIASSASLTVLEAAPAAKSPYRIWSYGYTSTYYGGQGDGGSCGYGTAQQSGYGVYTASASASLYKGGQHCGACLVLQCRSSPFCTSAVSTVVTVSNLCPVTSPGGWCQGVRKSYSLAPLVWNTIATNANRGVVPVRVARVPCVRTGGITFQVMVGNPFYLAILIKNVAGSGELAAVAISVGGGAYMPMRRSYGSVWSVSGSGGLTGQDLSFKLRSALVVHTIAIPNAIPAFWTPGAVFLTTVNFPNTGARGRYTLEDIAGGGRGFNATAVLMG